MKIRNSILLIAIVAIFSFSLCRAEEVPPPKFITFKDFYQKVSVYYPKLKQRNNNVNKAIARKLAALSGFLPRIQGVTSVTRGNDPVYVFGSLLRENRFTQDNFALSSLNTPQSHTTYNASLEAEMPIFDAFQTIYRVRSARLSIDAARYDQDFTRMEAFLVASEAYLRAVAIEKLLAVVTQVIQDSEVDIKQAEDLKEKGLILGADFYAAKVMHGSISQLKNQLLQEKQAAHIVLNILMGVDPFKPIEIQGNLSDVSFDAPALETWIDWAYKMRPDLAAIDKTIKAQGIEVSREKSTLLPTVDAFGEARQDVHKAFSDGGQNYTVGLKAKIDLFDPSYASRLRISREDLKKLEYDKTMLKDAIAKDLVNEYSSYQISQDNLPVTKKMLEDAQQAATLMIPLYREGRKSIVDLQEIRASYLNVAKGYYALATEVRASWVRLYFLSGQLDQQRLDEIAAKIVE